MPRKTDIRSKTDLLRAFLQRENRMPSYSEMLPLLGYHSKNAVHGLLKKLEALGYIRRNAAGKIAATEKLTGGIHLLGSIQAGFPSPAEEELLDTISLDQYLIEHPEATFMLRVEGDSMIEAGIQPGDLVLVEKGVPARTNDIVIAQVDGEWTMKYFQRDEQGVRLDPANSRYPSIRPKVSLEIGGVVRCVIRKY